MALALTKIHFGGLVTYVRPRKHVFGVNIARNMLTKT
jgi:hypothetical protein